MFYCQNCGAKIENTQKFCSFCGFSFKVEEESDNKDARIHELEQKIARLEQVGQREQNQVKKSISGSFSPWMAVLPIGFVAAFLGFFALIIWIVRQ